jgi:hypothetical protein
MYNGRRVVPGEGLLTVMVEGRRTRDHAQERGERGPNSSFCKDLTPTILNLLPQNQH